MADENVGLRGKFPDFIDMLVIAGVFVVGLVLAGVAMFVLQTAGAQKELVTTIVYPLQFLPVIIFFGFYRRKRDGGSSRLPPVSGRFNLPVTLWGILLVLVVSVLLEPLLELFPDRYFEGLEDAIGRGGWAILTTVVLAPILEEILFRGQIMGSVKEKYGPLWAIVVSALLFGLIHVIPPQVVNAFFVGIILGYVCLRTGSLLSAIIIHAVNNGLAYIQMEALEDPSASLREALGSDPVYFIIYGICIVLLAIGVVGMVRTVRKLRITNYEL